MNGESPARDVILSHPFFKDLPKGDIDFLLSADDVVEYRKGEVFVANGMPADWLFIIIEGWVKIYNFSADGGMSILRILRAGDEFGIAYIFGDGVYSAFAESVSDSRILRIPADALKERAQLSPDMALKLLASLARRVNDMQIANACLLFKGASQRVACLLLRLSSRMIGNGGTFKFPYEKSLAAVQLGMDQCTFSRALTYLDELGVKSKSGEITVKNFSVLATHCCLQCPMTHAQCKGRRLKEEKQLKDG